MEDLETSAILDFHGIPYVVTVQVQQQCLHVQVESEDVTTTPSSVWTGTFPASDIEQLTRQTGNSKRFPVFIQMLLTALHRRSDTVFVDLLTTTDLDLYRQRKLQPKAALEGLPCSTTSTNSGKRYLILTYAVEFDRVHYPLPLTQEQSPSPEVLQRTIRRLSQALAAKEKTFTSESSSQLEKENAALKEENRCLKDKLKQYDIEVGGCENVGINSSKDLQQELEMSSEEKKKLAELYQHLKEESALEMEKLRTEIKQLRLASQPKDTRQEQENVVTRRKLKDSNAAVQKTLAQMLQMKAQLEETQQKNRDLLRRLAISRARSGQGTRQRPVLDNSHRSDFSRFTRDLSPPKRSVRSSTEITTKQEHPAMFTKSYRSASPHYGPSDDEDRIPLKSRRERATSRTPFRRFDPTAYQLEKERKLREARANSRSRLPRSKGGYSSDSSAGGYSSADSRDSKTSSRSARSRGSRVSRERQRELDARLSSPKRNLEPPPLPNRRQPPRSSRGRSSSPMPSKSIKSGHQTPRLPSPGPVSSSEKPQTSPYRSQTSTPVSTQKKQPPQALLDTSADSFSDIDERLTALQKFLREAKQKGGGTTAASLAA
ncbi:uncharacterized protein PHALS_05129 [Plasmopara halstedii]|uniref:Coiled-coil domain-containing protein 61 n=1 Tax=Plasmopara halstedii TaxID=4781 RepID=A0A0P1B0U5_PLAHL|nr:uncharacterized protein PHALS_05129 [Plasmopara halstedii]CEG47794.1 hypothetical protein PHALS_05129 [Plasmopara halstedii]|eukprot:XP_024584163.1 hypothetical protein PHALS_05129 [Plasmopara halstedii]